MSPIFDVNDELVAFYNEKVKLSTIMQSIMADRVGTNHDRLMFGLRDKFFPYPIRFIPQGSYTMGTMIQRPNNDFDIDVGVVFSRPSLATLYGRDMTSLEARKMVLEALMDERFNEPPKLLPNCVRIFYNEGYHIDVPVYRLKMRGERTVLELASTDWKESDPTLLTNWFNQHVKDKSFGGDQLRRIVCLLKKWASSRNNWNLPNGLIFSVYAVDHFPAIPLRDDEALICVLEGIQKRLQSGNFSVPNPVDQKEDLAAGRDTKLRNLRDMLDKYLLKLTWTLRDRTCTYQEALSAWREFFNDELPKRKDSSLSSFLTRIRD